MTSMDDDIIVVGDGELPASASIVTLASKHVANPQGIETAPNNIIEHMITIQQIAQKYNIEINLQNPQDSTGLSALEAAKRLDETGPNTLTQVKKRHWIFRFLSVLSGLFNVLLIVAGVACYIILGIDFSANFQNTYLGAILISVAFMNALIEFYQMQKSAAILESFSTLIPAQCHVIRANSIVKIPAKDLVPGDLIAINRGDKLPADVRIIASTDLKVDNSSLTGESEPQPRQAQNTNPHPLEATNLVFNGSLVIEGVGSGIVIRTGNETMLGQIAHLAATETRREAPMSMEIQHFVKMIAAVAGVTATVFFIVAVSVKDQTVSSALNFAIGTFAGFVPEGLPAVVSLLLSVAAARMAKRRVICKDLQGVETLGAITLLATDKTGTLTKSQMTVTYIWTGFKLFCAQSSVVGLVENQVVEPFEMEASKAAEELLYVAALNSTAKFATRDGPIAGRRILGDATESGLMRFVAAKLPNYATVATTHPKVFEIPFNSNNKWALTIHKKAHATGSLIMYIKGAPERVITLCTTIHTGATVAPLSEVHVAEFNNMYTYFATKGHRVLAFAYLELPGPQFPETYQFSSDPVNFPASQLTFLGLASLEDPPKHGVREAIGKCRAAGIKVVMITGDHALTAESIARKINLMISNTKATVAENRGVDVSLVDDVDVNAVVVNGDEIHAFNDSQWESVFRKEEIIFARTSPQQKLDIVKRAQGRGHIVAVTGDGVNDSPALKKADLGIAMNISGSDVSKEAAAMILLDDNFASIVGGIEEGRLIFQNLKKSIQYTITHTMPEVWPNLLYIVVPLPLPLSPILILVVDLGFELFIALAYAYDVSENLDRLMKLPPRKPVTNLSVEQLNRYRDEDLPRNGDCEEDNDQPALNKSILRAYTEKLYGFFTVRRWKRVFEKSDDQVLIDGNMLSYAILEAGNIITIGCLICFFFAMWWHKGITPYEAYQNGQTWGKTDYTSSKGKLVSVADQTEALAFGQSAYYLALMFQQCFNHFICKARLSYPWGSFMFKNKWSFIGIFVGGIFSLLIVYIPPMNIAFLTNYRLTLAVWVIAVGWGVVLYGYAVVRVAIQRRFAPIKYTEEILGLQMYPTRFSGVVS